MLGVDFLMILILLGTQDKPFERLLKEVSKLKKEGFIKDKIIFVLLSIVIMLTLIVTYDCFIKTPKYSTYTTLALVKSNNDTSYTQNDININKSFVNTYSVIVKGKNVLNKTIKELNLNYSVERLSKEISVSSPDDSQFPVFSDTTRSGR